MYGTRKEQTNILRKECIEKLTPLGLKVEILDNKFKDSCDAVNRAIQLINAAITNNKDENNSHGVSTSLQGYFISEKSQKLKALKNLIQKVLPDIETQYYLTLAFHVGNTSDEINQYLNSFSIYPLIIEAVKIHLGFRELKEQLLKQGCKTELSPNDRNALENELSPFKKKPLTEVLDDLSVAKRLFTEAKSEDQASQVQQLAAKITAKQEELTATQEELRGKQEDQLANQKKLDTVNSRFYLSFYLMLSFMVSAFGAILFERLNFKEFFKVFNFKDLPHKIFIAFMLGALIMGVPTIVLGRTSRSLTKEQSRLEQDMNTIINQLSSIKPAV